MYHAVLVVYPSPCSSYMIFKNLNIESLERLANNRTDFTWELCEVEPCRLCEIIGLKENNLPAIIVNGVQISAGRVLPPKWIEQLLETI